MSLVFQTTALAQISSLTAPNIAPANSSISVGVLVVNKGSIGRIFVNLVRYSDNSIADSQSQILNSGESKFFILNSTIFTQPTYYVVQAGHTTDLGEDVVDDIQSFLVDLFGTYDGRTPPPFATHLLKLDVFIPIIFGDMESYLLQEIARVAYSFQGLTVLRVDVIPDKSRFLIWLAAPSPATVRTFIDPITISFLVAAITPLLIFIGVVIIGPLLISLVSQTVEYFTTIERGKILKNTLDAQDSILNNPNLTPQQKDEALGRLKSFYQAATALGIPWTLLVGGAVAVAALVGGAYIFSKRR